MSLTSQERSRIKNEIIQAIGLSEDGPGFWPSEFAQTHKLSIQTIYRYLRQLEDDGFISRRRAGRDNEYGLVGRANTFEFKLSEIREDSVWQHSIHPLVKHLPETAYRNCNYAFTEMLNNAIDHSGGTTVKIEVFINAFRVIIGIQDDGVGIFSKIADAMKLEEKRFAVLELAKGKFTTEPDSHSGEGIFFSSKAVDSFSIHSDNLIFAPVSSDDSIDSVLRERKRVSPQNGTIVAFKIYNDHKQSLKEIFEKYTAEPDHYGFTKTYVPVKLLEYGEETALFTSRSQAKRLLARFERFELIELDFSGIDEIGQGFADEIFRVFTSMHPEVILTTSNCNEQVSYMINRAKRF